MNIVYLTDPQDNYKGLTEFLDSNGYNVAVAVFDTPPHLTVFRDVVTKAFDKVDLVIGYGTMAIPVLNLTDMAKLIINPKEHLNVGETYIKDIRELADYDERILTRILYEPDKVNEKFIRSLTQEYTNYYHTEILTNPIVDQVITGFRMDLDDYDRMLSGSRPCDED